MPKSIETQAKTSLDQNIECLDDTIEQRLAIIRKNALNQPTGKQSNFFLFQKATLVSAFSLAAVALLLSFYVFDIGESSQTAPLLVQNEMLEDPELLAELEFIYWLSEENEQVLL